MLSFVVETLIKIKSVSEKVSRAQLVVAFTHTQEVDMTAADYLGVHRSFD